MRASLAERFWAKVQKKGPDECWAWTGSVASRYGQIRLGDGSKTKVGAHRVSFLLANGHIDDALEVLHSCDVKLCVNPAHLRQGTHEENLGETVERGRSSRGEHRWSAKLTEEQARSILAKHRAERTPIPELAEMHGVGRPLITRLLRGQTWKHLQRAG